MTVFYEVDIFTDDEKLKMMSIFYGDKYLRKIENKPLNYAYDKFLVDIINYYTIPDDEKHELHCNLTVKSIFEIYNHFGNVWYEEPYELLMDVIRQSVREFFNNNIRLFQYYKENPTNNNKLMEFLQDKERCFDIFVDETAEGIHTRMTDLYKV